MAISSWSKSLAAYGISIIPICQRDHHHQSPREHLKTKIMYARAHGLHVCNACAFVSLACAHARENARKPADTTYSWVHASEYDFVIARTRIYIH